MKSNKIKIHNCDICNSAESEDIKVLRKYSGKQSIHVCKNCGFVHVQKRRSTNEIAKTWSEDLYRNTYTARMPAIKARQTYVVDTLDAWLNIKGKKICDIGAGEGQMLEIASGKKYKAKVFGIEPSKFNVNIMKKNGIKSFDGTIEDYYNSKEFRKNYFDIVTIVWTLENCSSCYRMIKFAKKLIKKNGYLVIATGSRILVPFKKPLNLYVSKVQADTHSFRFSRNTLARLMMVHGFKVVNENRYIDTDYLVLSGQKIDNFKKKKLPKDNYKDVINFFNRWDKEQKNYK